MPLELDFTTYTLRYNRMHWLTIDGLAEHWSQADVSAAIDCGRSRDRRRRRHRSDARRSPPAMRRSTCSRHGHDRRSATTSSKSPAPRATSRGTSRCIALAANGGSASATATVLRKRHGLQGPIDDAFLDRFIFVRPTGKAWNEAVGKWARPSWTAPSSIGGGSSAAGARSRTTRPSPTTTSHRPTWSSGAIPSSNAVLKQVADKLPIEWTREAIVVGDKKFPADKHALIAVYPNPLNPERYVVLNSSFTFREYDYLNNARQVPKLPDWAVVDLTTPPNSIWPGKIADADFFDEQWKLKVSPERGNK